MDRPWADDLGPVGTEDWSSNYPGESGRCLVHSVGRLYLWPCDTRRVRVVDEGTLSKRYSFSTLRGEGLDRIAHLLVPHPFVPLPGPWADFRARCWGVSLS